MGRVRDPELDRLDTLLTQLRSLDGLHERSRGTFTRRAAPFLHFHSLASGSLASGLAADLKAGGRWLRYDVERAGARRVLLRDVRRVLRGETDELHGTPT